MQTSNWQFSWWIVMYSLFTHLPGFHCQLLTICDLLSAHLLAFLLYLQSTSKCFVIFQGSGLSGQNNLASKVNFHVLKKCIYLGLKYCNIQMLIRCIYSFVLCRKLYFLCLFSRSIKCHNHAAYSNT